ncbi:N-acetylmuramoyl-L-alanine amidase family protein [Aquibacillus salsiterrae]|uniref:N-acetylmuramoyl-L-alanine amidase n=1 Tax=Aquibacillus salsiterrae TaxID=2950439 RepID=A0A9X4AEC8_9BACI|nr:N-acetylmuramoyl-L-alanine amidase [Aquibacillus salsiterrae]MDC3416707.1 N-acetylmuramoyl-L-alanine amidase [Aquibacillus salsiterrae]
MERRILHMLTVIVGVLLFVTPVQAAGGKQVILDPGHGGKFTGTAGYSGNKTGYYEKDANLAVARKLRDILVKQGFTVNMTRETDQAFATTQSADLQERVNRANQLAEGNREDSIFISIHHNAREDSSVRGYETYYFDIASGINKSYPPDPVQVKFSPESRKLAQTVHSTMLNNLPVKEGVGIVQNNLFVTRNAQMPSVLVELGYLSNPDEERLLKTDAFQQQAAAGLAEAINSYYAGYDTRKIASTGKKYKVVHASQGVLYSSYGLGQALDYAKKWKNTSVYRMLSGELVWSNYLPEVYEVRHASQGKLFDSYQLKDSLAYAKKWKNTAVINVETGELMWSNYLPPVYEVKHVSQGVLYQTYTLDQAVAYAVKWKNTSVYSIDDGELFWSNYMSAPYEVVHLTKGELFESYQLDEAVNYAKKWSNTSVINVETDEVLWSNYQ